MFIFSIDFHRNGSISVIQYCLKRIFSCCNILFLQIERRAANQTKKGNRLVIHLVFLKYFHSLLYFFPSTRESIEAVISNVKFQKIAIYRCSKRTMTRLIKLQFYNRTKRKNKLSTYSLYFRNNTTILWRSVMSFHHIIFHGFFRYQYASKLVVTLLLFY